MTNYTYLDQEVLYNDVKDRKEGEILVTTSLSLLDTMLCLCLEVTMLALINELLW